MDQMGVEPMTEDQFPVLLRADSVIFHPLRHTGTDTQMPSVASYYAQTLKALRLSFPACSKPGTGCASAPGRTAATRQRMLNYLQRLI